MTPEDPTEASFRAWFEQSPVSLLVLTPDLRIVGASDAYLRATETERSRIVGLPLFEAFPENPDEVGATGETDLRASLQRVLRERRADTMAPQRYDIRTPEQGGGFEERWWSMMSSPVLDPGGDVVYIVHRVEDVTDFIQLQQQHADDRSRLTRMEMDIVARAREVQRANEQLRLADSAKSGFMSRMSHELRTPLTAIIGFGELLKLADLEAEHKEWVTVMLRAGHHLLELLNDVLDISRVEAGTLQMSVQPLRVVTVVESALEIIRPVAEARRVSIESDLVSGQATYVMGDVQRLRQVLINLLSNAVKYNRLGGRAIVKVSRVGGGDEAAAGAAGAASRDTPADRIRVSVIDEGNGLSPQELGRLFVPFERLSAASAGIEGTGLGLVLSQQLTLAMGGQLVAESEVGVGTTFSIELPVVEPAVTTALASDEAALIPQQHYGRRCYVLYVEDVAANIRLVEEILRRRPSVEVVSVMSGGTALELAVRRPPDLILLDLHLPDVGGDEVLRRLRATEATRDVPVVMLSADATHGQRERLLAAGAQSYLTKPIGVAALLAAVDEILGTEPA